MDQSEGHPDWLRYIEQDDVEGFRGAIISKRVNFDHYYSTGIPGHSFVMTPLGHALGLRKLWALEMLLEAGADPDYEDIKPVDGTPRENLLCRPIEFSVSSHVLINKTFLKSLLRHGASTCFTSLCRPGSFMDYCRHNMGATWFDLMNAAHDRELRAYTAVWCALNAGGSWPDMAMLLQAMVMMDELNCETPSSSKKHKK